MIKVGVITFPGSNCDDDARDTLKNIEGFVVENLWHKDTPDLSSFSLMVLPGGFSYGDYLRCGAMAACSPIMERVKTFASHGGFVIGICNGFQILCEAGLLPGALAKNLSLNFICRDVTLKITHDNTPWTCEIKALDELTLPIAHGEGRFVIDEEGYQDLVKHQQIVMTYKNNPNGSVYDIAGICNKTKNVLGLMPHPERATELRTRDGLKIWSSLRAHLEKKI